jgi:hypothetical protein
MATHTPLSHLNSQHQTDPDPLDAIIQIAEERRGYLAGMKSALETKDDNKLRHFAAKLVGMTAPEITVSA